MTKCEKFLNIMTKPSVFSLYLFFTIIAFLYIDRPIAEYLRTLNVDFFAIHWITQLGNTKVYVVLLFVSALYFRFLKKNSIWEFRCWFLWLCVLISEFICNVLKILLGRARPVALFEQDYYGFYGLKCSSAFWSFPSGHTTTILSLALGLSLIFPSYFLGLITTVIVVAITRILLLRHYLSDVLAAGYLVILEMSLFIYLSRNQYKLKTIWEKIRT